MAAADYDFTVTRTKIIEGALRKVGALGFDGSLSGEEMNAAADNLNKMVKEWQTKNIFLWQLQTLSITSTADVATLPLQTNPPLLSIDSARIVLSDSEEPLEVISWRDYESIANKAAKGASSAITLDNNKPGVGRIYIYPVPTVATVFKLRAVVPMKDWDLASDTGEMPQHWALALEYGLANILSDDYKLPAQERDIIERKANNYFVAAKISDRDKGDRTVVKGAY